MPLVPVGGGGQWMTRCGEAIIEVLGRAQLNMEGDWDEVK